MFAKLSLTAAFFLMVAPPMACASNCAASNPAPLTRQVHRAAVGIVVAQDSDSNAAASDDNGNGNDNDNDSDSNDNDNDNDNDQMDQNAAGNDQNGQSSDNDDNAGVTQQAPQDADQQASPNQ